MLRLDPIRLQRAFELAAVSVDDERSAAAGLAVASTEGLIGERYFSSSPTNQVGPESRFLLASITKPILAVAVMHLVENGSLSLAAPVSSYLPEFRGHLKEQVTVWHLLTHTSGIPEIDWATTLRARPEHAVSFKVACTLALDFAPGSRVGYSTLSFYVLAELLSRLSGLPYQAYVATHVLGPLGMTKTSFDPRSSEDQMIAVAGIAADSGLADRLATDVFVNMHMPGAGLWSTAADLVRFGRAFLDNGNVISPTTQAWMVQDHTRSLPTLEGDLRHYGLAWRKSPLTGRWPGSSQVFEHDGAAGSLLWIDPDRGLVIVYLSSSFNTDPRDAQHVVNAIYGALG
jgi:CubicO group peptidase (beta-lactamase class C family)